MCRMKNDCTVMRQRLKDLKRTFVHKMREKFGLAVNIDELVEKQIMENMGLKPNCISIDEMEEALMKCLVHDMRLAGLDIKSLYKDELILWNVTRY